MDSTLNVNGNKSDKMGVKRVRPTSSVLVYNDL